MTTERKPKPTRFIEPLTPEQRGTLDQWLFEENASYDLIVKRCAKEFSCAVSVRSLNSYYRKKISQRAKSNSIRASGDAYQAILKTLANITLGKVTGQCTDTQFAVIREFTKVLIAARREDIAAQKFALDREKWEFDIARACAKYLDQLQAITNNHAIDEEARVLAIRHRLFGPDLPE